MKKIFFPLLALCSIHSCLAQSPAGKITYERTMQLQLTLSGDNEQLAQYLPKSRTDKFELLYGNGQSLWTPSGDEMDTNEGEGGNVQIRMVGAGQGDIVFHDFKKGRKVEQREMFGKKFLIEDSVSKLDWKLSSETRSILGYTCRKATATRISNRRQMVMTNGAMERKEVPDTTNITAWFTNDIPVPAGPEVQGQLPGLVLALDYNNGRNVYNAIEISPKAEVAKIKVPTKGKKVSAAEFRTEVDKMMEEMQKNNQGSGNRIIMRH